MGNANAECEVTSYCLMKGLQRSPPTGHIKAKRELADGWEISLSAVTIGVLLILTSSRVLSLASDNGLLLKGGQEAVHSSFKMHNIVVRCH